MALGILNSLAGTPITFIWGFDIERFNIQQRSIENLSSSGVAFHKQTTEALPFSKEIAKHNSSDTSGI